jgi:transposase
MDRYIGLDAHASTCTLGVVGASGKRLSSQVVETNARALIEVMRTVPGKRHLCMEEGALAEWLYEVLEPHVQELVVVGVRESRGPKNDKLDAFGLAEQLRIGATQTRVYKKRGQFRRLSQLAKAYDFVVGDTARVKNRIKSVLRSRGVSYPAGRAVYAKGGREEWVERLPEGMQPLAELLYEEHDALTALRGKAEKALLEEAKKHREWHLLKTCPGLGPVRTAELLPVVVTPYRFQSRSKFWGYCGLGVVMRTSSDWVRGGSGQWVKAPVQHTRGLNRNFNHTLKRIFKGAATTVIGRAGDDPLYRHYERLLEGGTKPNLAKLTIARQIAAVALALWRSGERYDPKKLEEAEATTS